MSGPTQGRAVVFGLGRFGGGAGAARRLAREGWDVLATDLRDADALAPTLAELADVDLRYALGGHDAADFGRADLVVANPAVRPDHELLTVAREAGARITTEVELFLERATNPLLAVTGTQGKSSTVSMTTDFLNAAGVPACAGGNLGGSLLDALDTLSKDTVCVLELSSYQLEHLHAPAPRMRAVAVTNLLPDHLERHGTMAGYAAAKRRILDLVAEDGVAFLPHDPEFDDWTPPRGERVDVGARDGLFRDEGVFRRGEVALGREQDLRIAGRYQRENALIALGLAHAAGASPDRLARSVGAARGLDHRLQRLGRFRGREVFDNGVSTTPDSTAAALAELPPRTTMLVGGQAKRDLPWTGLARLARERQARVISFGAAADELAARFAEANVPVEVTPDLDAATRLAFTDDTTAPILFSPACASFDAYPNFRARALAFRAALPEPDPDSDSHSDANADAPVSRGAGG